MISGNGFLLSLRFSCLLLFCNGIVVFVVVVRVKF